MSNSYSSPNRKVPASNIGYIYEIQFYQTSYMHELALIVFTVAPAGSRNFHSASNIRSAKGPTYIYNQNSWSFPFIVNLFWTLKKKSRKSVSIERRKVRNRIGSFKKSLTKDYCQAFPIEIQLLFKAPSHIVFKYIFSAKHTVIVVKSILVK